MKRLQQCAAGGERFFNFTTMVTIYDTIIGRVQQGARCDVDFKKRSVHVNGKPVGLDGDFGTPTFGDFDEWLDALEDLYDSYKYSRPSQASSKRERKAKFRALSASQLIGELGHSALDNPMPRSVAQAQLELFVLFSLLNGSLNLDELFAKDWFYQGADKSLIIRKDWF